MNPEEEITSQLESIGYKCSAVKKIILTHLHEDHIGGLKYFPNAKIFINSDEWLLKDKKILGLIPEVYPKSLSMVTNVEIKKYEKQLFKDDYHLFESYMPKFLPNPKKKYRFC